MIITHACDLCDAVRHEDCIHGCKTDEHCLCNDCVPGEPNDHTDLLSECPLCDHEEYIVVERRLKQLRREIIARASRLGRTV